MAAGPRGAFGIEALLVPPEGDGTLAGVAAEFEGEALAWFIPPIIGFYNREVRLVKFESRMLIFSYHHVHHHRIKRGSAHACPNTIS